MNALDCRRALAELRHDYYGRVPVAGFPISPTEYATWRRQILDTLTAIRQHGADHR